MRGKVYFQLLKLLSTVGSDREFFFKLQTIIFVLHLQKCSHSPIFPRWVLKKGNLQCCLKRSNYELRDIYKQVEPG